MPSSNSNNKREFLLKLSLSLRSISFSNSNGNSLRLICLNCIVLGVHFIGMIRPGSIIQNHSGHRTSEVPTNPPRERTDRFVWSVIIQVISDHWSWPDLDDSSVPRLINPRNHRFFAGTAGCPGRLPQAEATSGEANNQKDLTETRSLSVWNTFDGSLK